MEKIAELFEIPFSCCTYDHILSVMGKGMLDHQFRYISITNTESLYHAVRIHSHGEYIRHARFSCCDGVGVVLAGKMLGHDIPRLHGPDLLLKCSEYGIEKGWRHYFYGGREGIPELLSANLSLKYPGFITAGTYSPPFRPLTTSEDKEAIARINQAAPDILWVGLGLLKQEKWIADHLGKVKVPWMIGVGAAFDFYAGTIKRAPLPFRRAGLEWLYRLAFEPRMLKRNLYSIILVLQAIHEHVKQQG